MTAQPETEPPTIEYAARVVYEALTACSLPDHVSAALAQRSDAASIVAPKWDDMTDEQRAWYVDLVWSAAVPFYRIDDDPEPAAVLHVVPADPDLFTQAVA